MFTGPSGSILTSLWRTSRTGVTQASSVQLGVGVVQGALGGSLCDLGQVT